MSISAERYDQMMRRLERRFLGASRRWVGERAVGEVLEVAIGTGLNLTHYGPDVTLTGLDLNAELLEFARSKADRLGRPVSLIEGDAQLLPFDDERFDTVVATFAMCEVADLEQSLAELVRVVRPGGRILLADHVGSANPILYALQWLVEAVTKRTNGEYWTRRPLPKLERMGVQIVDSGRLHVGIIEHLHARRL